MTNHQYSTDSIDILTGLQRNDAFLEILSDLAQKKTDCEVMLIGIDNFKIINNLYSYSFGNSVLQYFAKQLEENLPPSTKLFRLDGDCFGVIYVGEAHRQCEKFYLSISKHSPHIDGISILFTASAGICHCPTYGEDGDTLYTNISLALEQAKKGAKNNFFYYTPLISEQIKNDMLLLEQLRNSVAANCEGFTLNYQPIIDCNSKTLYGCEALLRFSYDSTNIISPLQFIPLLERSGMIVTVGKWVIKKAIAQCAKWNKIYPSFCMSINVSACQLDDETFPMFILEEIRKNHLPAKSIILELTESEQASFKKIRKFFDFIRKHGVQTALDDFGTGYASLDIFRLVSVDKLKIDRSFLERITDNVTDQILLKSILDMCTKMNILVCFEGIETNEIEHVVTQMGPELLQGYKYSRPISPEEFEHQFLLNVVTQESLEHKAQSPFDYTEYKPAQPMSLSSIVNNAYSGIFQVGMDKEFTFLTCNEGYRRMLGYTAREMDEKFSNKALGFVHPDDVDWVNQEILNQLRQGDTVNIEFRVVRSDGRPIWILGTGNLVRTAEGNPSIIVNIIENDKRKLYNLRNEESLAMYEKILSLLPTGIKCIRYDADFTIEYISPGFLNILGYTLNDIFELFENKYILLIHEDDRQKVFADVIEQLETSNVVRLYYRSVCKNGNIVWLETISYLCPIDADGIQRCYSSVVNVTETISEEDKARSLNIQKRLQKASNLWGEVLFEYNFLSNQLTVSESFVPMFGHHLPEHNMINSEFIFKDRNADFLNLLEKTCNHECPSPIELPAFRADGKKIWCRILAYSSEAIGGENVSVIGKIFDIDAEFKEREALRIASQTDSLTGLFNKGFSENSISARILEEPNQPYSCWIIDVDNFKGINDTLGHFVGDKILLKIGERLRTFFHENDIIGRIGGDEFLIFATNDFKEETYIQKGDKLLKLLQEPFLLNHQEITPRVSVGVSFYPKDGTSFIELYQNADNALYQAKSLGKSKVCFFEIS